MKKSNNTSPFQRLMLATMLAASVLWCGCATHYDITTGNGMVTRARTKPKLNEQGYYVFEDLAGQEVMISRMRVRQIEAVRRGSAPSKGY